jgi:hypothetical protein
MGYFAARAAPLGAVPAEAVVATFYNFHPAMVARAIPAAWTYADPSAVLDARLTAVDRALRRLLGSHVAGPEVAAAAALARRAAQACDVAGRPLFAANAALPWPDEPHLELWSATTRLREHRGDGHVATLVATGVGPYAAHVLMAGAGRVPAVMLRENRWWSEDEWAAATDDLRWLAGWTAAVDSPMRVGVSTGTSSGGPTRSPWRRGARSARMTPRRCTAGSSGSAAS